LTGGGESKFEAVIHIVLYKYKQTNRHSEKKIAEVICGILTEANEMNLGSVAIPPIGTGVLKIPVEVCVKAIQKGIADFVSKYSKPVCKSIEICIFEPDMAKEFKQKWNEGLNAEETKDSGSDSEEKPKGKPGVARKFSTDSESEDDVKVVSQKKSTKGKQPL
jgi:O-acetyl-ADP-ribose deacetylase (regulator of RNase III)